jgi:GT2 family glycosyltransferase
MLELLKNINTLNDVQNTLEEIIVVNNASTEDYSPVNQYISDNPALPVKYFDAPENLGVAKGRNYAIQKGKAPYLIMLDDDAVLQNKDCLNNLLKEFENNISLRPKAIISFKVLYFENLQMQVNALPHKRFNEYKDKSSFETYYYAGGAHAVRRDVISILGMYPNDFFYGMEEYDLSYRILEAGYSICYSDKIIMLHKESPLGRKPKNEKLRMMWVNKTKVAYRYLPKIYFFSTAVMWSLQYLKITGFNLTGFFKGWKEIFGISSTEKRTLVNKTTLEYLDTVKARLWY